MLLTIKKVQLFTEPHGVIHYLQDYGWSQKFRLLWNVADVTVFKNSVRTPPTDENSHSVLLTPILIILCNLNLGILSYFICSGFLIKLLFAFLSLRVHVSSLFYLIVLYLSILLILGEGYKL
jgi:hypothetical protein